MKQLCDLEDISVVMYRSEFKALPKEIASRLNISIDAGFIKVDEIVNEYNFENIEFSSSISIESKNDMLTPLVCKINELYFRVPVSSIDFSVFKQPFNKISFLDQTDWDAKPIDEYLKRNPETIVGLPWKTLSL